MGTLDSTVWCKSYKAKFSIKLQLFRLKMNEETSMSSHVTNLMFLLIQLFEACVRVENKDAKAILFYSLPSIYSDFVFMLSQMSSQNLDETITTLLAKEKRLKPRYIERKFQLEKALFTNTRMRKKNANKSELECYYCRKIGNTSWN